MNYNLSIIKKDKVSCPYCLNVFDELFQFWKSYESTATFYSDLHFSQNLVTSLCYKFVEFFVYKTIFLVFFLNWVKYFNFSFVWFWAINSFQILWTLWFLKWDSSFCWDSWLKYDLLSLIIFLKGLFMLKCCSFINNFNELEVSLSDAVINLSWALWCIRKSWHLFVVWVIL